MRLITREFVLVLLFLAPSASSSSFTQLMHFVCYHILRIARLLVSVDMPDDVIRQTVDAVPGPLCHLGEALRLGLVLECVGGEVDAGAVDVGFDDDVDAADAVEGDFFVRVVVSVTHFGHVDAVGFVFFVA